MWYPLPLIRPADLLPNEHSNLTITLSDLEKTGFNVFNFEYPVFSEIQKARFEEKFRIHFALRQIGHETPGRFQHQLKAKLWDIMPLYIQKYESELTELLKKYDTEGAFNPLFNVWERTKLKEDTTGKTSTITESSADMMNKHLDTPQNAISNLEEFLTDVTKGDSSGKSESSGDNSVTYITDNVRYGNIGVMTFNQLINGFRQTFLNVDLEIIRECEDLFLGIY